MGATYRVRDRRRFVHRSHRSEKNHATLGIGTLCPRDYPREALPYQKRHIQRWLDYDLTHKTLASLRGVDFAKYRDARRADGRTENTIRLELQIVSHLFEIARKEWGMKALPNPLKNIRKPSDTKARDRRLHTGEFEKLYALLSVSGNS